MFSSLRSRLALSHLSLVLLTAAVLGMSSLMLLEDFHKRETFALLERSVTSNSLQTEQFFTNKSFLLKTIITSNEVKAYSRKHQDPVLRAFLNRFKKEFDTLRYISPLGFEEVRMGDEETASNLKDFSANPLIRKAIETSGEVFYDVIRTDEKPSPTIEFAISLHNYFGDELICLIHATCSSSALEKHLSTFAEDLHDRLIITDAEQTILFHPDPSLLGKQLQFTFNDLGYGEKKDLGLKGLYTSRQLITPLWRITRVMPYKSYTRVYKNFAAIVLLSITIVSVLGLVASFYGSKRIIAPIRRLTEAIAEVASNKKSEEVEKYSIKELDSLVDSFNKMLHNLTNTTINKDYLDNILNSLQEGLFVVDLNGTTQSANQKILDLLEISAADFIGQPINLFLQEEQIYSFLRSEKQIDSGGVETTLTTSTQKTVPVQFFSYALTDDDDIDNKLGFVCLVLDISQRHKIQKETDALRYQLHQSQRLESVGTLASGIAHDFNNILTVVIGFSQLLQAKINDDPTCKNALEQILTASYRARDLVKQLLAFSRQEEHKKGVITLQPIVKETLKMLRSSIPSYIGFEQNISSEVCPVLAGHSQIQQVLMNLCTNATHAIKKSGTISVSLNNVQVDMDKTAPYQDIPIGDYAEIVVSDDGHGIKEHDLDSIFDPFFTTKDIDEGTGLGLSVVHGIVQNLKGHILVQSKENIGTTFRILIPGTDQNAVIILEDIDKSAEQLTGRGEHLLFVDDEQSLVDLLETTLTARGYRVTATTSPEKAFELFKAAPDAFDMLITDFAMPKVKGDELVHKVHAIRNDLPIILCTGYHAKLLGMDGVKKVDRVIKKPYTAEELIYNISSILQQTKHPNS